MAANWRSGEAGGGDQDGATTSTDWARLEIGDGGAKQLDWFEGAISGKPGWFGFPGIVFRYLVIGPILHALAPSRWERGSGFVIVTEVG